MANPPVNNLVDHNGLIVGHKYNLWRKRGWPAVWEPIGTYLGIYTRHELVGRAFDPDVKLFFKQNVNNQNESAHEHDLGNDFYEDLGQAGGKRRRSKSIRRKLKKNKRTTRRVRK